MNIQQFLKKEDNSDKRIVRGDRWLEWGLIEWVVSERKYHKKLNTVLYRGSSLGTALKVLDSGVAEYD